eukprot:47201-Prymnesium_polylepis.1
MHKTDVELLDTRTVTNWLGKNGYKKGDFKPEVEETVAEGVEPEALAPDAVPAAMAGAPAMAEPAASS